MAQAPDPGADPDPGATDTVAARRVFDAVVGEAGSIRTARRWLAEALAAGIVLRTGATSSTRYGLPPPCPIPDAPVVEPPPTVVEEPVEAWTEPVSRPRWPAVGASPLAHTLAGGPTPTWGATGPPVPLPTGPAAA